MDVVVFFARVVEVVVVVLRTVVEGDLWIGEGEIRGVRDGLG